MRDNILPIASIVALVGLPLLSGCAELQEQVSNLGMIGTAPRLPNLSIRPEILPDSLKYRPVRICKYSVLMSDRSGATQSSIQALTVQAYRDRFLITSDSTEGKSTALVSRTGYRYSFNILGENGSNMSSKTFGELAPSDDRPIMNNMDYEIPEYLPGPKNVGDVIAWLRDSQGNVQEAFIYRGLTYYSNRDSIVMMLVRTQGLSKPTLDDVEGFSIVDKDRALPLLLSLRGSPSIRAQMTECAD